MKIGWLPPSGEDLAPHLPRRYAEIRATARDAEAAGFDALWVSDHLLYAPPDAPPTAPWEAWTLLSALAEATGTALLGTLVSATSFRPPGTLAKMAHTLQEISGGRLVLGVGAGWHEPEYTAFGLPFDARVERFGEALPILATLLRDGRASFAGRYHTVEDCPLLPPGAAGVPAPPILVGCRGPRMMRLTAQWADAWNGAWFGVPGPRFAVQRDALHRACGEVDRDPATLEITVGVLVGSPHGSPPDGTDPRELCLPPDPAAIAEALAAWRAEGVGQVIFWTDPPDRSTFDQLAAGLDLYRRPT